MKVLFFDVGYTLVNEDAVWEARCSEQAQTVEAKKLGGKTGDSTDLLENVIYTFGGKTKFDGKKIIVAGRSAVFFKLT